MLSIMYMLKILKSSSPSSFYQIISEYIAVLSLINSFQESDKMENMYIKETFRKLSVSGKKKPYAKY